MKIYKVVLGHGEDEYGYSTHEEIARYFFSKKKAEELCESSKYTFKETRITTVFKDGSTSVGYTGANWFEDRKKNARPNEKVELVERTYNRYYIEEIEVEE